MKNQYTLKQHYYPRMALRHFANDNGKVYVYNQQAQLYQFVNYETICFHKKTYESKDALDNILENKLQKYESKAGVLFNSIITKIELGKTIHLNKSDIDFVWNYMWLQMHRTDAGRIRLIYNLDRRKSDYSDRPMEIEDIRKNKDAIYRFNDIYKNDGALEVLLKSTEKPLNMNFHIAIPSGKEFITTDNPVITIYDQDYNVGQLLMPIHPKVYLVFENDNVNCSDDLVVCMTNWKTHYVNHAIINIANYYVISNKPFDVGTTGYIEYRFKNPNWHMLYPQAE